MASIFRRLLLRNPGLLGWLASSGLHLLLAAAVVMEMIAGLSLLNSPSSSPQPVVVQADWAEPAAPLSTAEWSAPKKSRDPAEKAAERAPAGGEAAAPLELVPVDARAERIRETRPGEDAWRLIEESIDRSRRLEDDEARLERLESTAGLLEEVSSEESVDEITATLGAALGVSQRASAPAEGRVEGPFDVQTAQFHDVVREETPEGGFRYTSILVDAEGRTMEAELTEEEGEPAYRAMQMMKDFPLAERLYRGLLMSLFDDVLRRQPPGNLPPDKATDRQEKTSLHVE